LSILGSTGFIDCFLFSFLFSWVSKLINSTQGPVLPFPSIPSHPDGVHCRDSFVSDMNLIYIQLFLRRLVVLFIIYLCMLFGFVLSLSLFSFSSLLKSIHQKSIDFYYRTVLTEKNRDFSCCWLFNFNCFTFFILSV